MNSIITNNLDKLIPLFKNHKVARVYLFGSALGENFNEKSDVDFLISFQDGLEPLERGELWWDLHDKLRDFLNREVDILIEGSQKNPYFISQLNKTKELIYD